MLTLSLGRSSLTLSFFRSFNHSVSLLCSHIFFDSNFQKIVLLSLLLFSCACYYVYLDDIQENEVATSWAHNFNNDPRPQFFKYDKPLPKYLIN